MNLDRTTFLYSRPSFMSGFARAMDLSGSLNQYNESQSPEEADEVALKLDMMAVANDLWEAIDESIEEAISDSR